MSNQHNRYSALIREQQSEAESDSWVKKFRFQPVTALNFGFTIAVSYVVTPFAYFEKFQHAPQEEIWLLTSFFLVTFAIGIRLLQSLLLAKRDYGDIKFDAIWDIAVFVILLIFTLGAIPHLLILLNYSIIDVCFGLAVSYAMLFCLGTLHYFHLIKQNRVESHSTKFDHPVENVILQFNMFVLFAYALLFSASAYLIRYYPAIPFVTLSHHRLIVVLNLIVAILAIQNIAHSHKLSYRPKFLLTNASDTLKTIIARIQSVLAQSSSIKSNDAIIEAVKREYVDNKTVKTVRCTKQDSDRIANELIRHFGYVFSYIFGYKMKYKNDPHQNEVVELREQDKAQLKQVLKFLIEGARGFGGMGYMNFYFIENDKFEKVGLFKLSSANTESIVYRIWILFTYLKAIFYIVKQRGMAILKPINRHAAQVINAQPQCGKRELILDYLIVFPPYQGQQYGLSFLHLLVNAYLKERTDELNINQITALVREKNHAASQLFLKAGFTPISAGKSDSDPIHQIPIVGQLIGKPVFLSAQRKK